VILSVEGEETGHADDLEAGFLRDFGESFGFDLRY
jgi:hypothetical protein